MTEIFYKGQKFYCDSVLVLSNSYMEVDVYQKQLHTSFFGLVKKDKLIKVFRNTRDPWRPTEDVNELISRYKISIDRYLAVKEANIKVNGSIIIENNGKWKYKEDEIEILSYTEFMSKTI